MNCTFYSQSVWFNTSYSLSKKAVASRDLFHAVASQGLGLVFPPKQTPVGMHGMFDILKAKDMQKCGWYFVFRNAPDASSSHSSMSHCGC